MHITKGLNFLLLTSLWALLGESNFVAMAYESDPRVVLGIGEVAGKLETFSSDFMKINRKVAVYQGIPYAEPPVGYRRFQPPAPVIPWEGIYEANDMPPGCPQVVPHHLKHLDAAEMTTENCLFLNVFVPMPTPVNSSIMVYIHGGDLTWGSGLSYPADPLPLAAVGNVILVTLNYRLGLFGFLSTGDEVIPPNLGLHDQRAALKWVHDNIEAFGGDPNKVTIFGNEAGAVSVGWHLLSPQSRQFFQRVILQSGNPLSDQMKFISPDEALRRANVTASLVGCSFAELERKDSLRKCLAETHVADLVTVGSQMGTMLEVQRVWQPVLDNDFFPKPTRDLVQDGGFGDIDVIIGMNKHEGTYDLYQLMDFPREKPFINRRTFETLARKLDLEKFEMDILTLLYVKENFRFDNENDYFDALSGILTDTKYTCNVREFAWMLQTAGCKVYMYELTHDPQSQSVLKFPWSSAGHMEDLKYVFGLPFQTDLPFQIPEEERLISAHFMRLWTNFARTGDPNISGDPKQPLSKLPVWQEYSNINEDYKKMESTLPNGHHLQTKECYTWQNVLPKLRAEMAELKTLRSLSGETKASADQNKMKEKEHDEL